MLQDVVSLTAICHIMQLLLTSVMYELYLKIVCQWITSFICVHIVIVTAVCIYHTLSSLQNVKLPRRGRPVFKLKVMVDLLSGRPLL
jgi:hypothetical protein